MDGKEGGWRMMKKKFDEGKKKVRKTKYQDDASHSDSINN